MIDVQVLNLAEFLVRCGIRRGMIDGQVLTLAEFCALKGEHGKTMLQRVAETNDRVLTETLILYSDKATITARDSNDDTLIHVAARNNAPWLVEKILHHFNAFGANLQRITPVHIAGYAGNDEILEILLNSEKCTVSCKDLRGNTPLLAILLGKKGEKTELYLKALSLDSLDRSIAWKSPNIELHLYNAIDNWDVETVQRCITVLVKYGMWTRNIGSECLFCLLSGSSGKTVKPLNSDGKSDADQQCRSAAKQKGFKPLIRITEMVLEAGADIYTKATDRRFSRSCDIDIPTLAKRLSCADKLLKMIILSISAVYRHGESLHELVRQSLNDFCYVNKNDETAKKERDPYRVEMVEFLLQQKVALYPGQIGDMVRGMIREQDFKLFRVFLDKWEPKADHIWDTSGSGYTFRNVSHYKAAHIWEIITGLYMEQERLIKEKAGRPRRMRMETKLRGYCERALEILCTYEKERGFPNNDFPGMDALSSYTEEFKKRFQDKGLLPPHVTV